MIPVSLSTYKYTIAVLFEGRYWKIRSYSKSWLICNNNRGQYLPIHRSKETVAVCRGAVSAQRCYCGTDGVSGGEIDISAQHNAAVTELQVCQPWWWVALHVFGGLHHMCHVLFIVYYPNHSFSPKTCI